MTSSNAMRQLEERHVATKVELMVWSNKMDLLALSNVRGEVALHRLNWQKVWALAPPSEGINVKGMAWRPDGKVIAIAYSNSRYQCKGWIPLRQQATACDIVTKIHFQHQAATGDMQQKKACTYDTLRHVARESCRELHVSACRLVSHFTRETRDNRETKLNGLKEKLACLQRSTGNYQIF